MIPASTPADRTRLRAYLEKHLHEGFFSKHYGSYMMPIFVQEYFAIFRAPQKIPGSMPHGMSFQNFVVDREFDWQWSVKEMQATRAQLFAALEKDLEFGKKLYQMYQQGFAVFDERARAEEELRLEDFTPAQIVQHLLELINAAGEQGMGYTVDCLLSFSDDDWFKNHVNKYAGQALAPDDVEILRAPTHRSFVNSYALRLLAERCRQNQGVDIAAGIEQIVREYYWVENNYLKALPKTAKQVRAEINNLSDAEHKYAEEQERLHRAVIAKENVFQKISATPLLRSFVQFADDCTFIQDCRKQAVLRLNHFNINYLGRLAELVQFDPELIQYVMFNELEEFLQDPARWQHITVERRAGCLAVFDSQGYAIFLRDELKDLDLSNFFPDLSGLQELKGMTASPGKVTGTARIILGSDQFHQFQAGEILITNQTTPDFVPLMKKAAAVVAEQGGVTSHAAIVSRELGIPCIVGAKKAMAVFVSGEQVEVDATKGLIRKVS